MPACSQFVLALASLPCSLEATSPRPEAHTALESVFNAPEPALPQGGTVVDRPPTWFVSVSANYFDGEFVGPLGKSSDDYEGLGIDVGYTNWREELGITLEGGYLASSGEVDLSSIDSTDLDTQRLLLGVRFFDRGSTWWLPYLRGGFMWREDSGDSIDDDGPGWYAGGGFDFFIGDNLRIGPQLLYTDSESLDTTEWILGGVLTFAF